MDSMARLKRLKLVARYLQTESEAGVEYTREENDGEARVENTRRESDGGPMVENTRKQVGWRKTWVETID